MPFYSLKQEYRSFSEEYEAKEWGKQYYPFSFEMDFGDRDFRKICLLSYTGSCSKGYNHCCREFLKSDTGRKNALLSQAPTTFREISEVNDYLWDCQLPENIIVYHFTEKKVVREHGKSGLFGMRTLTKFDFTSTTLIKKSMADAILDRHYNCVLHIYLPKGMPGAYVSADPKKSILKEHEFLLPPAITFQIIKIHWLSFPLIIECKALLPSEKAEILI